MADLDLALRKLCLDHLTATIDKVAAVAEPFPHFVVREFFPNDVYQDLLRKLPDTALYEPFSYGKHHTDGGESNRLRFQLTSESLERLDGRSRSFWFSIRSVLGSVELKRVTFDKVAAGLAYRYSIDAADVASLPGFALPELFHERGGYAIAPHPDTRRKVVTMQIALPRDESQRELGTEFYARSLKPASLISPPRGFVIARRMDFLPNAAYAFAVLNTFRLKSWHGRTAIPASLGVRNSILNIWYAKVEDANAELAEEVGRIDPIAPETRGVTSAARPDELCNATIGDIVWHDGVEVVKGVEESKRNAASGGVRPPATLSTFRPLRLVLLAFRVAVKLRSTRSGCGARARA